MTEPLISIVVPSYNQVAFIGATLKSILEQDYPNVECIVMDGGSTDGTVEVLRGWSDARLSWVSERDKGQSDAINKGMHRARGDIVSYLNSDDLLRSGAVRFTVEYLIRHASVDLIYGDCDLIDEAGAKIGFLPGERFDLGAGLLGRHFIRQPGTFWRRSLYERVGDFDTTLNYSMDTDYWLRTALAGFALEYVPGTRSAFRLHHQSKSVSMQPKFLQDWRAMMDKTYANPDLPVALQPLKSESYAFAEWGLAKTYWSQGDYAQARPLLRKFIGRKKWGRRLVAMTMWLDSYLHTPLTRLLAAVFRRFTGQEILFGEQRTI